MAGQAARRAKGKRPATRKASGRAGERQAVGNAKGKQWGGGEAGRRVRLTEEKEKAITQLHREGKPVAEIARVVGLSRPTI